MTIFRSRLAHLAVMVTLLMSTRSAIAVPVVPAIRQVSTVGAQLTSEVANREAAAIEVQTGTFISLSIVKSGFDSPIFVTHAGDSRLFIVERTGKIKIIKNAAVLATPFLDVTSKVTSAGSEQGLLGLAFEPGVNPDRFYIYYNEPTHGNIVIERYAVSTNIDVGDAASATPLLQIDHSVYGNHNGGWMGFGRDGFLYVAVGDGGGGGNSACTGSGGQDVNGAQALQDLRGKMLRLNVVGQLTYTTPVSNAFADAAPEVFAIGLRNPWRDSFDRQTGDLYIGDVGQGLREEVDVLRIATAGANLGWPQREGLQSYANENHCNDSGRPRTEPILDYGHDGGNCAITGGYVYRGVQYPALGGTYFYADYCTGKLWSARPTGAGYSSTLALDTTLNISSFGEDVSGELYVVNLGGSVYALKATTLLHSSFLPAVRR